MRLALIQLQTSRFNKLDWDSGKCCQHNLLMPSAKVLGKGAGDGFRLGRATGSLI